MIKPPDYQNKHAVLRELNNSQTDEKATADEIRKRIIKNLNKRHNQQERKKNWGQNNLAFYSKTRDLLAAMSHIKDLQTYSEKESLLSVLENDLLDMMSNYIVENCNATINFSEADRSHLDYYLSRLLNKNQMIFVKLLLKNKSIKLNVEGVDFNELKILGFLWKYEAFDNERFIK